MTLTSFHRCGLCGHGHRQSDGRPRDMAITGFLVGFASALIVLALAGEFDHDASSKRVTGTAPVRAGVKP